MVEYLLKPAQRPTEQHVDHLDADERHDDAADTVDQQVAPQQRGRPTPRAS